MEQATMCHAVPRIAAKTRSTTKPATLSSNPMPWVVTLAISSTEWRNVVIRAVLNTIVSCRGGQHKGFHKNLENGEPSHHRGHREPQRKRKDCIERRSLRFAEGNSKATWRGKRAATVRFVELAGAQKNQKPGAPVEAGRISGALTPKR